MTAYYGGLYPRVSALDLRRTGLERRNRYEFSSSEPEDPPASLHYHTRWTAFHESWRSLDVL